MMWPRQHPHGHPPLLHQASVRLLWATGGALLLTILLTLWILQLAQERTAQREIRDATEYFSEGIREREKQWEEAAVRYKSRLEFARLLENPAHRWDKITSYLSSQNQGELFPALLLADLDGRVRFAFGIPAESVPATFASPPDSGWHFNPHNQTLYRYYVLHMWLGAGGMGRVILFQPLDHAVLSQMATQKTRLFLRWHDRTIAASSDSPSEQIQPPLGTGQIDYEGQRFMQDRLLWDKAHPESPELVILREIDHLFDYWEVALGITVALAGLFAALWVSIGIWAYRTTRRITQIGEASRRLTEDGHLSADAKALLEDARQTSPDEICAVAQSIESLTATVARGNAEGGTSEASLGGYYDSLTRLPNRRLLMDRLNQALAQATRHHRALAVMCLNLDRFKRINDTLGRAAGDELLQQVAARLTGCVRNGDTVSRQDGDEFAIVLAEIAKPQDAALVAEKIFDVLTAPFPIQGQMLRLSLSIGIAIYPADGTDNAAELMKKADQAMHAVKKAGRNDYRFSVE